MPPIHMQCVSLPPTGKHVELKAAHAEIFHASGPKTSAAVQFVAGGSPSMPGTATSVEVAGAANRSVTKTKVGTRKTMFVLVV